MIGDCTTTALISQEGSLDWCCLPTFDDPFAFARLLDVDRGGYFSLRSEGSVTESQRLRNTNVLETSVRSASGAYRITDFMPWGSGAKLRGRLVRLVETISGNPRVTLEYDPRPNYARDGTRVEAEGAHSIVAWNADHRVRLCTSAAADDILGRRPVRVGDGLAFVLSADDRADVELDWAVVQADLRETLRAWRDWVRHCHVPRPYQEAVLRSALTLKMLVFAESGAVVAAPTLGLPEELGGVRNWDYRYCWLRDSYFVVDALYKLSLVDERDRFADYLKSVCAHGQAGCLRPVYTIRGDIVPREQRLDHLGGYGQSRPVRVGNNATDHQQNDVFGEVVLALHPLFVDETILREDRGELWQLVRGLVSDSAAHFPRTDSGPWEFNHIKAHYTFSKLMTWVAHQRGAEIASSMGDHERAQTRISDAGSIRDEILRRAWNPDVGAFTQAYGSRHLDASTLLMPVLGIIDARDPRMLATLEATERALMRDDYILRYDAADDFGPPQNAFLMCSFWFVDSLILRGELDRARMMFERILGHANHLGLFSEHIDQRSHELLGNFPQGYAHVAVIYTATLLSSALYVNATGKPPRSL